MCNKTELEAFVGRRKPIPQGCFLGTLRRAASREGSQRWISAGGDRIYTWDALHGEVEGFNIRGRHIGAFDPCTGAMVKSAVKGRSIDV
jgi:hypothetical protein